MTEEEIKEWFFERYESDTPPEDWDILDIWEEICRLRINNSVTAYLALEVLIKEGVLL